MDARGTSKTVSVGLMACVCYSFVESASSTFEYTLNRRYPLADPLMSPWNPFKLTL